jgi:hypothetical protein
MKGKRVEMAHGLQMSLFLLPALALVMSQAGCKKAADDCKILQTLIPSLTAAQNSVQSAVNTGAVWPTECPALTSLSDKISEAVKDFDPKAAPQAKPSDGAQSFASDVKEYSYEIITVCTAVGLNYDPKLITQFGTRAQSSGAALLPRAQSLMTNVCGPALEH